MPVDDAAAVTAAVGCCRAANLRRREGAEGRRPVVARLLGELRRLAVAEADVVPRRDAGGEPRGHRHDDDDEDDGEGRGAAGRRRDVHVSDGDRKPRRGVLHQAQRKV